MKFCHFKCFACAAFFAALTELISCSSTQKVAGSSVSPVYVTNSKKYYLMDPSNIKENIDSYLFLKGKFGENEFGLLSMLQMDEKGVYLCLLSDFGTTIGELSYDGKKVDLDCPMLPKKMKGEYIVADLQFAFYKYEAVMAMLSQLKLGFEEFVDYSEDLESKEVRTISDGKKVIERITKTKKSILIENLLRGYSYELMNSDEESSE